MERRKFLHYTSFTIGGMALGGLMHFTPGNRSVRFGVISDLHYAAKKPVAGNNRYYSESLDKVKEFVEVMNEQEVDFIIELGDFKDQDNIPREENTLNYLQQIEQEFQTFDGPAFHVLGNHDHDSISKQQFLNNISNPQQAEARNYYSFNVGGFHAIVLDANYTLAGRPYNRGNFDWKEACIPPNQLEWLKNDLSRTEDPTLVFVHQRLDYSENIKSYCVNNATAIQDILNDSGKVILAVQGHYHEGDLKKVKQIAYLTMKAAVEGSGPDNNNYGIVTIDAALNMKLTGFRKTTSCVF